MVFQKASLKSRVCLLSPVIIALSASICLAAMNVAVDKENKAIAYAMTGEPPDLNSIKSTDSESSIILEHVLEGLLRYGKNRGKVEPGVAQKWEMRDDGVTFFLRKNARWSDGKPVTAHDFVFAWRKVVDPVIASEYAYIFYPIKNAEAINTGKTPPSELGVKAVDDYTLKVEFEQSCGYFLELVAFSNFFPVREDFYNSRGEKFGANADDILYNGPYKITKWVHGAALRLEKNEAYWDRDNVKINVIDIPYFTENTLTRLNLFKDNKIALADMLDAETMKTAVKERLKIKKSSDGALFFLEFNHRTGRVTRNKNFRKAIQHIFDSQILVDKVIAAPGNISTPSLFPSYINGKKTNFRKEYPAKQIKVDIARAKAYLETAKKELGVAKIPPITMLCDDRPLNVKITEYMQSLFKSTLGLDVKIDIQIFKQRLEKMKTGSFDIVLAGWGPDYNDPLTFADLFSSWSLNNRGRYKSEAFDGYVRAAQASIDPKTRMDAMAKIQDLVTQDVVVLPLYERGTIYLQSRELKGIVRKMVGSRVLFTYADIR